jgi:hypothetical protein
MSMGAVQAAEREHPRACRADVQKLCKEVQPGGGRIAACMKQHEQELSPGCREQTAGAKKRGRELEQAQQSQEQFQQKLEQATQQMQQRAERAGGDQ